jgi:hypothetical protein
LSLRNQSCRFLIVGRNEVRLEERILLPEQIDEGDCPVAEVELSFALRLAHTQTVCARGLLDQVGTSRIP